MKNTGRKLRKIFLAMAAVLLTVMQLTSTALAANPGLIDPSQTGSITIHKYDNTGTNGGTVHDGTELPNTNGLGNPLGGIVFTIVKIPDTVLLQDAEQYITNNPGLPTYTQTTANDGVTAFKNLPLGVYYVKEEVNSGITAQVSPFLISIPMTNPTDNSSWLYDVHVYPKNTLSKLSVEKDVLDSSGASASKITADVGDEIKWAITPSIPADIAAMDVLGTGYFFITDDLDSRLNYKSVTVQLKDQSGTVVDTLLLNTHYDLSAPAAGTAGGQVKVNFDVSPGIDKLADALAKNYTLEIVVATTINNTALADLSNSITNSAKLYYKNNGGDPSNPEPPTVPENPDPEVKLGGIALYKWFKDNGVETALAGAEFTIYSSDADAKSNSALIFGGSNWTLATDSLGYIYFSGKDIETAVGTALTGSETFYLVETKAPQGFELLDKILGAPLGTTLKVENTKLDPGFTLPITGGTGTLLYTAAGVILIAAAVIGLVVYKKRGSKKKA